MLLEWGFVGRQKLNGFKIILKLKFKKNKLLFERLRNSLLMQGQLSFEAIILRFFQKMIEVE